MPRMLGFTALGALAQIAATALMLITMKSQSFAVTTAWLKTEPVHRGAGRRSGSGRSFDGLPSLAAIAIATAGVLLISLKPGRGSKWLGAARF